MKKQLTLALLMLAVCGFACAQTKADQMSAFKNAYDSYQIAEEERAANAARAAAHAAARAAARAAAEQKKRDAENQRRQEIADRERAKNDAYRDEMRRLDIQERKSDIARRRATSSRANEYIDRDLMRQDAETDVVKSNADANRNISSGIGQGVSKGLPQPPANTYNIINK